MTIRNWKDIPLFKDVTDEQWNDWHWQVANRLDSVEKIKAVVNLYEGVAGLAQGERMSMEPAGLLRHERNKK